METLVDAEALAHLATKVSIGMRVAILETARESQLLNREEEARADAFVIRTMIPARAVPHGPKPGN
jgi:hypothetical protein